MTMDTAGKAVLLSGATVLISLSAVLLVPSPAFRSTSLGIMLAVIFVLAATLTLLPAVLAKLGPKLDNVALPWANSGERRSARFGAWAERLWKRPVAYGAFALAALVALAIPVTQLKIAMPSIKVVPTADSSRVGYQQIQAAMGPGATGPMQIVAPVAQAARVAEVARRDPGIAALLPIQTSGGYVLVTAIPKQDPSNPAVGAVIDRLRVDLPAGSRVGGAAAENHDLQTTLAAKTPLVIGVVLGLGFVLLLVALQAPLLAAVGVLTNLLATAAAFGVAKWIFQDGTLHSLLGFQPQGFLDAWAPVFFFAMIFAISMDYTVFLLSSAKEHWDRTHDPQRGDDRRACELGAGDLRRRRRDGRRVLYLRALRPAPPEGDGNHPRHRCAPRRSPDQVAPAPSSATPDGLMGMVPPALGTPCPARALARTRVRTLSTRFDPLGGRAGDRSFAPRSEPEAALHYGSGPSGKVSGRRAGHVAPCTPTPHTPRAIPKNSTGTSRSCTATWRTRPTAICTFPTGRPLAEAVGYPADLLGRLPTEAVNSFAGVGYHFGLARLRLGERVLDLGSGSGMDVFAAAAQVGPRASSPASTSPPSSSPSPSASAAMNM